MKDRIPGAPGQYSAVVPGGEYPKMQRGEPFAITLTRDDKPLVEGTPYSKAAVLPDLVAKRLCPGVEDPTPADAFESLSKGTIPTVSADPDTLLQVIANARPGTTIQLAAGNYGLLKLVGRNAYPEGLTIVGGTDVKMAGVSITSGIWDYQVNQGWANDPNKNCCNADVSNAVLPMGLTFRNITFTDSFSLRNASVNDLTIDRCTFASGKAINIDPNNMHDCYGKDYNPYSMHFGDGKRPQYAMLAPKNLVIRDCTINNATKDSRLSYEEVSAIRVLDTLGVSVYRNIIKGAVYNGVNIGGTVYSSVKLDIRGGLKVAVTDNTISNTGSRSIQIYNQKDATVMVMANTLKTANTNANHAKSGYIGVESCRGTTLRLGNGSYTYPYDTYNGANITVGNGIAVKSVSSKEPAMREGVEYLTEEWWNGKPVYTKLMNLGAMPSGTGEAPVTAYYHDVLPETAQNVILDGYARLYENDRKTTEYMSIASCVKIWATIGNGARYIGIKTKDDYSAYNAYIVAKYTKSTD